MRAFGCLACTKAAGRGVSAWRAHRCHSVTTRRKVTPSWSASDVWRMNWRTIPPGVSPPVRRNGEQQLLAARRAKAPISSVVSLVTPLRMRVVEPVERARLRTFIPDESPNTARHVLAAAAAVAFAFAVAGCHRIALLRSDLLPMLPMRAHVPLVPYPTPAHCAQRFALKGGSVRRPRHASRRTPAVRSCGRGSEPAQMWQGVSPVPAQMWHAGRRTRPCAATAARSSTALLAPRRSWHRSSSAVLLATAPACCVRPTETGT